MNVEETLRVLVLEMRAIGISLNRQENEINHLKVEIANAEELKMSLFSDFADNVVHTMQVEHDLVMELTKEVKLLGARVEKLEGKK